VVGWGGTYLEHPRTVMRYEFLRIGGHPELLVSSRKEEGRCLSMIKEATWL